MTIKERITALASLGERLLQKDEYFDAVMHRSHFNNQWFTVENQQRAVKAIANHFLQKEKLEVWVSNYGSIEPKRQQSIGLVMAGNIPLVGFHDLLCVFVSGHKAKIKLSDKDKFLIPYLLKLLSGINPAADSYFEIIERLKGFDAVIATGSNNSARYFESYFGKVPNIIRKNRNAVAVMDNSVNADDLNALGKDVFRYFGLGCRNVSKLYLPKGYDFQLLLEKLHEYKEIILHSKYKNNYDYNMALLIMNKEMFWNNGCIILAENVAIASRIAMLHYEFYDDREKLALNLAGRKEEIQCIVSKNKLEGFKTINFGKAQEPSLHDYADGVNTMKFLTNL